MTTEELKQQLLDRGIFRKDGKLNSGWIHSHIQEYDLSTLEGDSTSEKLYLLFNKRTFCEICGNKTQFISWYKGYNKACCDDCRRKLYGAGHIVTQEEKEKRKNTCLKKYGVGNPQQNKEVREKTKETVRQKYKTDYVFQSLEFKEKSRDTCLEKYGVEYTSQIPEVIEKKKKTCLEKCGYVTNLIDPKCREQYTQKWIKTCGVDNPLKSEKIQNKVKQTNLSRYNVENALSSPEIQQKIRNTIREVYGVDYATQNPLVQEKTIQTNLKRRGVKYVSQDREVQKKKSRKWEIEGKKFASKWEIYYYYYLLDENIPFEEQFGISHIDEEGISHTYFCDFKRLDTGELVEIKNPAFINENGDIRTIYKKGLTEEKLQQREITEKSKQECMVQNRVTLIKTEEDIKPYKEQFLKNHKNLEIIKEESSK